jgi:hypothetical protein
MKRDKQLFEIYKKCINKPIYRVVPSRNLKKILKQGINPDKNPYEKIIPDIKRIYSIIKKLENKNIVIKFSRGKKEVTARFICEECLNDLKNKYIDFCGSKKHIRYYLKFIKGGGIPSAIKRLTKRLLEENLLLTRKEKELIKKINKWANSKKCENKIIYLQGSSKSFEGALFQLTGKHKNKKRKKFSESEYLPSPFGSFEHFKKVIQKYGLRKYHLRLKNKEFNIRVKEKIPANEIHTINKI